VAVKIVRQAKKIALLGAPTSAAAMSAGHEGAPAALRNAGLAERLTSIGYEVNDLGDDPQQIYKPDEESPRARNLSGVVSALEALKPRVEQAVKSCALPLILSGDCSVALAVVAGARRYFRRVGLLYMDRDADLNTPATTPSGCVDGMVVSHLTGRGAAELVRFWGEPPLVREPDLALFGVDRLDPSEEEALRQSPLRSFTADEIKGVGVGAAANLALERIHAQGSEFVLHFDVDVIAGFQATNYPGSGGLTLDDVREAIQVFMQQKNLAAVEVTAYNPIKDPDGSAATTIVDLLARALEKRLQTLCAAAAGPLAPELSIPAAAASPMPQPEVPSEASPQAEEALAEAQTGEAWSSDSLMEAGTGAENGEKPHEEEGPAPSPTATVEIPAENSGAAETENAPGEEASQSSGESDETTA
jgi:arginase